MFERFTERARRAVVPAQQEARSFGHSHIGAEHILLALIGERTGVAARARLRDLLRQHGIDPRQGAA